MPTADDLEKRFGHPGDKHHSLLKRIEQAKITRFSDIQDEWIDLMWTLDRYRVEGVPPDRMGNLKVKPKPRLSAIYRGKGNWFAEILARLLTNHTGQSLAPRQKVIGFSQPHQIDVAWPAREQDPLVCLETKVTGAPGDESTGPRRAMSDWTNRRKELKFAATDLKLFRRQHETSIDHWDVWRVDQPPKTYFLWAALLSPRDRIESLVRETHALQATYLDGAGIVAWRESKSGDQYEVVPLPAKLEGARTSSIDDMLYRIASEIKKTLAKGKPPPPELPAKRTVNIETLADEDSSSE